MQRNIYSKSRKAESPISCSDPEENTPRLPQTHAERVGCSWRLRSVPRASGGAVGGEGPSAGAKGALDWRRRAWQEENGRPERRATTCGSSETRCRCCGSERYQRRRYRNDGEERTPREIRTRKRRARRRRLPGERSETRRQRSTRCCRRMMMPFGHHHHWSAFRSVGGRAAPPPPSLQFRASLWRK